MREPQPEGIFRPSVSAERNSLPPANPVSRMFLLCSTISYGYAQFLVTTPAGYSGSDSGLRACLAPVPWLGSVQQYAPGDYRRETVQDGDAGARRAVLSDPAGVPVNTGRSRIEQKSKNALIRGTRRRSLCVRRYIG